MRDEKLLMAEAATLYYEKECTQQEIAEIMSLSRQTVSKLLNDAIKERIVEIKIHNPKQDRADLAQALHKDFHVEAIVCSVGSKHEALRQLATVKAAADYLQPLMKEGNQKIAVSWGRTIEALIEELPQMYTDGNLVFPLFGATDHGKSCFSSNELTRGIADKLRAEVRYAWFPYLPDHTEDRELLKKTSYYKKLQELWETMDLAIVGIGNTEVLELFGKTFGYREQHSEVIGDIATHFFTESGELIELYPDTLCASSDDIKQAKRTVAIACGHDKVPAIVGAVRTGLIDTLITDEYTARQILESHN